MPRTYLRSSIRAAPLFVVVALIAQATVSCDVHGITSPGSPSAIVVSPSPTTIAINGTQQFSAAATDFSGAAITVVPTWSIVSGGGTISASGVFTAGTTPGTFRSTVKATSGGISDIATVIVTVGPLATIDVTPTLQSMSIGAKQQYIAVGKDVAGNMVAITPEWFVVAGGGMVNDAIAAQAQIDLATAYTQLANLPCPPDNFILSNLGGTTKTAGVYCSATSIGVTGTLTLDGGGDPNATFVFQAGTTLTTAGNIVLINGAQAKNVYWLVGSSATIGTGSQWQGNIIALTSITMVNNATLFGRALAREGAVTLGTSNVITLP